MLNAEITWRELMKCGKENFSDRIESDRLEKEFWKNFIDNNRTLEDEYAKHIKKIVLPRLKELNCNNALEIGPGWGNYTFDIAKETKKMDCLDISDDILNFILHKAKEKNINNINGINCKLEDAELDKYNFVFGYNCFYRIKTIEECLNKIVNSCNGLVAIGMNSRLDREPTLEIEEKLNINIKKHCLCHRAINNVLEEMGIKTEVKEIILSRSYDFNSIEDAMKFEKSFILTKVDDNVNEEIKKIVKKHYKYDGIKYSYNHEILAGIIFINRTDILN